MPIYLKDDVLGIENETIIYDANSYKPPKPRINQRILKFIDLPIAEKIKRIRNKFEKRYLYEKLDNERIEAFKKFTKKYINETSFNISKNNISVDLAEWYDFFIVGSDQVWNPAFRYGSPVDFLTFAPKHKRISFAASFGTNMIPKEHIENYKFWLMEMKSLSVREKKGQKL